MSFAGTLRESEGDRRNTILLSDVTIAAEIRVANNDILAAEYITGHPQLVLFTASHAGGCCRGPLRRCRRRVMPAARIPAAGILCRPFQLLAWVKGLG